MVSYLRFLADQDAATGATQRKAHEPRRLENPQSRRGFESRSEGFR